MKSRASVPGPEVKQKVLEAAKSTYAKARWLPPNWSQHMTVAAIDNYLQEVIKPQMELKAGSGVPYALFTQHGTHADWLEDEASYNFILGLVVGRLKKMLALSEELPESPSDLVCAGLVDPVRLFIKQEPHKLEKIQTGRFRLISSVSLVDQLIARLLFTEENLAQKRVFLEIPSQPGLGLSSDLDAYILMSRLAIKSGVELDEFIVNHHQYAQSTDMSNFDWSVDDWMLQWDMDIRDSLCATEMTAPFLKLRRVWLHCLTRSLFMLSDGTLVEQTSPGIQKSGSFNTSSSNSMIRWMLSFIAGSPWSITLGDDCVEGKPTNLEVYESLGFKVKPSQNLDFCSHVFTWEDGQVICRAENEGKMLFKILSSNDWTTDSNRMAISSVLYELRHSRSFELYRELLLESPRRF